jgi:hypothetical protein
MDRSIRAGISGFTLAIIINLFLPISLGFFVFIPSFLAAIIAIYISRLETLKDGLVAAFMTYIFNDGILNTLGLATLYVANEPYELTIDNLWIVFSPIVSAVTAVIAAYVGVRLAKMMKPSRELPPSLPPPLPPV